MSMSLRLPFMIFKKLIVPNTCQLSSTVVRCRRDEAVEDLDLNDEDKLALGQKKAKIIQTRINSMRLDLILKAGLGLSRNKVELAFYESRVRRNGQKALKKSAEIYVGDEIDFINSDKAPENPKFINVSRLKIIDAELDGDRYDVQIIRDKNLIIEDETIKY